MSALAQSRNSLETGRERGKTVVMHGQAAEVYCASLVNEDSYEAPYLNIDRERENERPWMSCYIGCLPPSLPPRRPPCVCLSNAESPLRMPSASNASLRQAGSRSVSHY